MIRGLHAPHPESSLPRPSSRDERWEGGGGGLLQCLVGRRKRSRMEGEGSKI